MATSNGVFNFIFTKFKYLGLVQNNAFLIIINLPKLNQFFYGIHKQISIYNIIFNYKHEY